MTVMLSPKLFTEIGILPIINKPVRFAVGHPNGITSNSWRIWAENDDVYISCRDNFQEAKVSLHASGRWRMGFTTEAIKKNAALVLPGEDRAWEVWDSPPEQIPNTTIAFRLYFSKEDIAVSPKQRAKNQKKWTAINFIEAPPAGKLTVISLFITKGDIQISHQTERSFCLASLELSNNKFAKIIAHAEPEGNIPVMMKESLRQAREQCEAAAVVIPKGAYGYFLGNLGDGSRFLKGAKFDKED